MNISRNFLIVLIVLVFVGGAGTAYAGIALPTITLGGNVDVLGDMDFTSDNTSLTFPATALPNQPMIEMFKSGITNADRMVIAHSPDYPDWGLQYGDLDDEWAFIANGDDILTISSEGDVNLNDLTVNGDCAGCMKFYHIDGPGTLHPGVFRELSCDPGDVVVGGGAFVVNPNTLRESRPADLDTWYVSGTAANGAIIVPDIVNINCADVSAPFR